MLNCLYATSKIIIPILVLSILMSCSASTHLGKITIQEPKTDEKVYQKWFLYYQDQFDANNGIVNAPENEKPDIARQAYTDALKEWEKKVEHKQHQNTAGVTFLTLGLIVVSIVLVIGAMDPSKSMKFGS